MSESFVIPLESNPDVSFFRLFIDRSTLLIQFPSGIFLISIISLGSQQVHEASWRF